jgi:nitrite reductase/ring-hydroxylating ferredoxin subunit
MSSTGEAPLDGPLPADVPGSLQRVAILERTLACGPAEVWENVLDWPHIPWLHPGSFTSAELLACGTDWWRARVGLAPAGLGRSVVLELRVDRAGLRYVTETLEGPGSPAWIVSTLTPMGPAATAIRVEFFAAVKDAMHRRITGQAYLRVYRRLWDEDEGMIVARRASEAALAGRGIERSLGRRAALALPQTVVIGGARVRIFAVGAELRALALVCPHMGGPLPDEAREGCRVCPWHGYRYDEDGRRVDGRGAGLRRWTVRWDPASDEVVVSS